MNWKCTIRPTRFRFQLLQGPFWVKPGQLEIQECCCLQDGLRSLALEGRDLRTVVAASFETPDGWQEFSDTTLNEIRAIALEEAGCH